MSKEKKPKTLQDIFSDYKSLPLSDRINFVIAAKEELDAQLSESQATVDSIKSAKEKLNGK